MSKFVELIIALVSTLFRIISRILKTGRNILNSRIKKQKEYLSHLNARLHKIDTKYNNQHILQTTNIQDISDIKQGEVLYEQVADILQYLEVDHKSGYIELNLEFANFITARKDAITRKCFTFKSTENSNKKVTLEKISHTLLMHKHLVSTSYFMRLIFLESLLHINTHFAQMYTISILKEFITKFKLQKFDASINPSNVMFSYSPREYTQTMIDLHSEIEYF